MSKFKAFIAHMFTSKWEYSEGMEVRMHKVTGKVEYWNVDDWGGWFDSEPMFEHTPLWGGQINSQQ
jgi:hypothetical protein